MLRQVKRELAEEAAAKAQAAQTDALTAERKETDAEDMPVATTKTSSARHRKGAIADDKATLESLGVPNLEEPVHQKKSGKRKAKASKKPRSTLNGPLKLSAA